MNTRFLMYKPTGVVFVYDGRWANNPEFVEVADSAGTPLSEPVSESVPEPEAAPKAAPKPRAKKAGLSIPTPEPEAAPELDLSDLEAALAADASHGLP